MSNKHVCAKCVNYYFTFWFFCPPYTTSISDLVISLNCIGCQPEANVDSTNLCVLSACSPRSACPPPPLPWPPSPPPPASGQAWWASGTWASTGRCGGTWSTRLWAMASTTSLVFLSPWWAPPPSTPDPGGRVRGRPPILLDGASRRRVTPPGGPAPGYHTPPMAAGQVLLHTIVCQVQLLTT